MFFFQANGAIFKRVQDIIRTNILTKFHGDWTINVTLRAKCPNPGGNVSLGRRTINGASRVLTRKNARSLTNLLTKFHDDRTINVVSSPYYEKCPAQWRPYIIGTNLLTRFHADRTINVASRELTMFY
ncbi:hypothetical protein DPMN_018267 [Dreissena polymorpha]|uniref:Uncharacterized protein n=1 Tax=Dreissena polymorpha TaxID=45954 RepID=A0A9D4NIE8_DREPO|nr:hypothetical protein DPMN_018267 [Dreissena polymorpha]